MRPKADIETLFSAQQIQDRVNKLAYEITQSIGTDFLLISILKGSFVFSADLIRSLHRSGATPQIDFLTLSSYGAATESSGHVEIKKDIDEIVKNKSILLVDDILESGRTLAFAKNILSDRGALSVDLCVFLNKPGKRKVEIEANFIGFDCPDKFVVGYGLDYAHYFRELPFVGSLR
ncbi:MAG: Hypoxanthine phosphoribosyltransferase [Alphaproteobacteria bacterium MarineAlpha2_Bin1]|nr:MAG: Hypoxanthine phosphoribosyltransferase [Alphaproteobacteria bacterium MarineAlpha2_Bin1]|tara:strand:- start:361 stop:891 length:531 start_codon:yes stop_codon:yes gene_type:complete